MFSLRRQVRIASGVSLGLRCRGMIGTLYTKTRDFRNHCSESDVPDPEPGRVVKGQQQRVGVVRAPAQALLRVGLGLDLDLVAERGLERRRAQLRDSSVV